MLNGTNGFALWNGFNKPATAPCADSGCSGMSLMSGGEDELGNIADAFADAVVVFLTNAETSETTTAKDIASAGSALMGWCNGNLTPEERDSLRARLEDPSLAFVDAQVRRIVPQLVSQLNK